MRLKPNLLCIVPPYNTMGAPPLGSACLLSYLRANGCDDFDFLDLRLWAPNSYAPTYRPSGVFGETYVMDIPDLPLVLQIIQNFEDGRGIAPELDERFERYCLERGISASFVATYLQSIDRLVEGAFSEVQELDFVGFSVWSSNLLTTLIAAANLKRRRNPPFVALGGPQTTESAASAKLALRSGLVDAVALGEGEETLLRLYESFRESQGGSWEMVPGIIRFDQGSGEFEQSERPLLRLPQLPLPAFDKLPLMSYQQAGSALRTVTSEFSRGCTDKCTFCSEWVFWKRIRLDDVVHAVDKLEELGSRFGAERVWFMDSLLNASPNRLREFATQVLERDLGLKWGGYMRANVDEEMASLLKRAGCDFVFLGIESLSDETLELMNKRRTGADNLNALHALLDTGMRHVVAGLIPGFPGDQRHRFEKTALALRELHREHPRQFRVNVEPFTVSPSQPIYADMASYGLEPRGWDDSYLEIAPAYRDLTEEIYCHVEGPNQGMDRLGELRVAMTVTAPEADLLDRDPFLYADGNTLSNMRFEFTELEGGWDLAMVMSESALQYGLILSRAEKDEYEQLSSSGASDHAQQRRGGRVPLLAFPACSDFIEGLESEHLIPPRRSKPRIGNGLYHTDLTRSHIVCLSPFAIARRISSGSEPGLLVVDCQTRKWIRVEPDLEDVIALVSDEPRSVREIERLSTTPSSEILEDLGTLKELGMVMICGEEPEPPEQEAGLARQEPIPRLARA